MGIRTPDLLHAMQALYQLSYSPLSTDGLVPDRPQRHASVQETRLRSRLGTCCTGRIMNWFRSFGL